MHNQDLLNALAHRPWSLPEGPWVMTQTWHNVLFAHWPIPPEVLRPIIPACFDLDTFDGQTWLGIVPFRMSNVRFRFIPPVPFTHSFPELNVRTYVASAGKPGVYFFSLDAASAMAVLAARLWFNLPYFHAQMSLAAEGSQIHYRSQRKHNNAPSADFVGSYLPASDIFTAQPGTLDHWLTERYCLYALDHRRRPYRGDIHHLPWPLQRAEATIQQNTMALAQQIRLPDTAPLLHYAHYLKVLIWPPKQLPKP